ncbi:MAG: hypothetical protein ACSLFK_09470 [Gemmatimonadaceae bacterium]
MPWNVAGFACDVPVGYGPACIVDPGRTSIFAARHRATLASGAYSQRP